MLFYNKNTGENINVQFRKYESRDAEQLLSCISDIYGDGYPYKEFLDGEYLDKMCKEGKMIVTCGETDDGEIISVAAFNLDTDFKGSGIFMLRAVKKSFQKMGIGNSHKDFLFEITNTITGACSVYGDVMSNNTTSQNGMVLDGFTYTGIRLMLYHNKIMLPKFPHTHDYKLSQTVMCRKVSCNDIGKLYCPSIHSEFVEDIYNRLGVKCEIITDLKDTTNLLSNISIQKDNLHNNLKFFVFDIGNDFESTIKDQLLEYKDIKEQTYICYLNMKIETSIYAYDILSKHGFFFTGIKPLNDNGEFMILSKVNGEKIDINEIKIHENGRYILDYISKHGKASGLYEEY